MAAVVLKMRDLRERYQLPRSTVYAKLNPKTKHGFDPSFPQPRKLGARTIGWYESDIEAWLANRPEGVGKPPAIHKAAIPTASNKAAA